MKVYKKLIEMPVASIERWYDRSQRSWCVRVVDAKGNQVGDATYVASLEEALLEEHCMTKAVWEGEVIEYDWKPVANSLFARTVG